MAGEVVYKDITDLDVLSGSLDGNETTAIVKSGKTYRRSLANLFGAGWITSLLAAFSVFKAPDADHADDADTVGGEDKATLHSAPLLTGAIHLDRIPAELTGKNAASATTAAACSGNAATATSATTAAACSGNAATADKLKTARTIGGVSFDGSANINLPGVNTAGNQNTSGHANSAGGLVDGSTHMTLYAPGSFISAGTVVDYNIPGLTMTMKTIPFGGEMVPSGHIYVRLVTFA